jgi:hypothetical protein
MARWLVLECVKEEGVQVVSVAAASASSWRRRRWRWPAFPAEDQGTGELDLERERDVSAEKKRGTVSPISGNLHRCRRSSLARAFNNGGMSWSPWRRVSSVREGVEGKQMSGRGVLQRGCTSMIMVGREGRRFWSGVVS